MGQHICPGTKTDDTQQFIRGFNGELFDCTTTTRPDTSWRFTDARGHEHRWYADGVPATGYSPSQKYTLPTLTLVTDVEASEDYLGRFHYECANCLRMEETMARPIAGYSLYQALKDEGYELPPECGDVEMRLPVDGLIQLAYIVNLTDGTDGSLVKFGRALVRMAEKNK